MSQIIYEKKYPQETPEEPTYAPEGRKIPDMSFGEFMRRGYENRFSIPIPDRENGAKAFIATAKDVSELYQLNIKITEHIDHISADFYFNAGGSLRYFKDVIRLADDVSFFSNVRGYDIVMSLDYYTHDVFIGGQQIYPLTPRAYCLTHPVKWWYHLLRRIPL